MSARSNKLKIINDPIYGFITIPGEIVFDLIEHPYFQRLRRIKQLGLTSFVYPGALHTRFHHAMGAMHLMGQAIALLRSKNHEITNDECLGATIAILLHDIGHGPFSHSLESSIVEAVNHEDISAILMDKLNEEFGGKLDTAIAIFRNKYPKKFLHQLVSSQLDMDRLDYLKRDSFFTGVSEGVISSDRIITMLNVVNDELVIESKGIYSIEKFIVARRLMYWQVYLHKTVISAENLLVNILKRAKELAIQETALFASPDLALLLSNRFTKKDFIEKPEVLEAFVALDDYDIHAAIKVWSKHPDKILSTLCKNIINRQLYKVEIRQKPFDPATVQQLQQKVAKHYGIDIALTPYFVFTGSITNSAYNAGSERINILYKNGEIMDIADAADLLNISMLARPVEKFFLCHPKDVS